MLPLRIVALLLLALPLALSPGAARAADCNGNGVDDAGEPDGDTIGNACDCDFTNDGVCGGADFILLLGSFGSAPANPDLDLDSVEIFDPGSGSWSKGAPMPTGRRTGGALVVDGEVLVMGGERTPGGGSFVAVEVYDPLADDWSALPDMPVGRHGAVWGRIGSAIFVATGGPTGGSAFTADVDVFHYR